MVYRKTDEDAFELAKRLDALKKKEAEMGERGASTNTISKMNAPSPISRAFKGEKVANMMSRRFRQKEKDPEPQRIAQEQSVEPEPEPIVVEKNVTVKLPEETQKQLDQIQDSLSGAEKDIVALAQVMKDFLEKSERAKHQDVDSLFRNRCANRRTQGFCKLTAKGKLAKGAQLR